MDIKPLPYYDRLPPDGQALLRALWRARIDVLRSSLNLERDFMAAGYRYAELDGSGELREAG